jgi:hypothetical protein
LRGLRRPYKGFLFGLAKGTYPIMRPLKKGNQMDLLDVALVIAAVLFLQVIGFVLFLLREGPKRSTPINQTAE